MSINLFRIDKNYFGIYSNSLKLKEKIMEDLIYHKWTNVYKLPESELDFALNEMGVHNHNAANFSTTGTFIYSNKN